MFTRLLGILTCFDPQLDENREQMLGGITPLELQLMLGLHVLLVGSSLIVCISLLYGEGHENRIGGQGAGCLSQPFLKTNLFSERPSQLIVAD